MLRNYVSIAKIGYCKICDEKKDLRCGVCFHCADDIAGEQVSKNVHRLYDRYNAKNFWFFNTKEN